MGAHVPDASTHTPRYAATQAEVTLIGPISPRQKYAFSEHSVRGKCQRVMELACGEGESNIFPMSAANGKIMRVDKGRCVSVLRRTCGARTFH